MKVGIVTTWFERGAAYVSKQYRSLLLEENDVFIYARGGESYARNEPDWDGPEVTWGRKALFQMNDSPVNKRDFKKWIQKNKIEVVFFNEQQWWPPVLWAKELGVVTGAYVDYYTEETVPLFDIYDFVICNTRRHLSAFDWHPACHFLQWGTDTDLFCPGEKLEKDSEKVVFFLSAGMNPDRKGGLPLLRAFAQVNNPRAKLLIHSQVDLFSFYPSEHALLEELLEKGVLEVINETVTAPGLYYRADVYTYISKLDGIGLTLAEAASSGLPIITPDQPPMSEFVIDGETGALLPLKRQYSRSDGYYWPLCEIESRSLVEKIEEFSDAYEKLPEMKAATRRLALEKFEWKKNQDQLCKIFREATQRELSESIMRKARMYELRRAPYWPLIRLPYKIMRNLQR